jgi:hypothetical protein
MADVVRYKALIGDKNQTLVEIFQREVGKTQRYMYIPINEITKSDADLIAKIITNGGNIANPCVFDVVNTRGKEEYYFKWKVVESLKKAEAKVFDDVFEVIRVSNQQRKSNQPNVVTASNSAPIVAKTSKQINNAILDELQKVEKGDIINIIRKRDGSIFKSVEVIDFRNYNGWSIDAQVLDGMNKGSSNLFRSDYWEEVLKDNNFDIQIIKKVKQAQPQEKQRLAVDLSKPHYISEVIGDSIDGMTKVWKLRELSDVIITKNDRNEFFVEGDVLEATSLSTPVKKLKFKVVGIHPGDKSISYQEFDEYEQKFEDKVRTLPIEKVFQTPIDLIQPIDLDEKQPLKVPAVQILLNGDLGNVIGFRNNYWDFMPLVGSVMPSYRNEFFVVNDILELTNKTIGNVVEEALVLSIDLDKNEVELQADSNSKETLKIPDLFRAYKVKNIQPFNLVELFDQPTLVPKDSGTTPIEPSVKVLDDIEQAKKDLGQLIFMRNLISPIDFEQKIEVTQLINEKQKLINDLNFKGIEEKMSTDQFFDDLFEQSFTPIQHQYEGVYGNEEETEFFTPNGSRSGLSDQVNEIIRTPQFKEWFGDWELAFLYKDTDAVELECSKVLTSDYEPRLVWHGTGQQFSYFIFDNFPAAYFAVNKDYSQFFADLQGGGDGYVIPFFLNIRNPLDLTHFGINKISAKDFFDYMYLMTGLTMEQLDVNPIFLSGSTPLLETWMYIRNSPKMLKKIADSNLYDGIHFYESNPNIKDVNSPQYSTEAYITFRADQCKIADPNRGMLLFASLKSFLLEKGGKI